MSLPPFHGRPDEDIEEWLDMWKVRVAKIMRNEKDQDMIQTQKYLEIRGALADDAWDWYEGLTRAEKRDPEFLVAGLRSRFPYDEMQEKRAAVKEFQSMKQGTESLESYIAKARRVYNRIGKDFRESVLESFITNLSNVEVSRIAWASYEHKKKTQAGSAATLKELEKLQKDTGPQAEALFKAFSTLVSSEPMSFDELATIVKGASLRSTPDSFTANHHKSLAQQEREEERQNEREMMASTIRATIESVAPALSNASFKPPTQGGNFGAGAEPSARHKDTRPAAPNMANVKCFKCQGMGHYATRCTQQAITTQDEEKVRRLRGFEQGLRGMPRMAAVHNVRIDGDEAIAALAEMIHDVSFPDQRNITESDFGNDSRSGKKKVVFESNSIDYYSSTTTAEECATRLVPFRDEVVSAAMDGAYAGDGLTRTRVGRISKPTAKAIQSKVSQEDLRKLAERNDARDFVAISGPSQQRHRSAPPQSQASQTQPRSSQGSAPQAALESDADMIDGDSQALLEQDRPSNRRQAAQNRPARENGSARHKDAHPPQARFPPEAISRNISSADNLVLGRRSEGAEKSRLAPVRLMAGKPVVDLWHLIGQTPLPAGFTWADLFSLSPYARKEFAKGLTSEKKKRARSSSQVEEQANSIAEKGPRKKHKRVREEQAFAASTIRLYGPKPSCSVPCFYTTALIRPFDTLDSPMFSVSRILLDGGASVCLITRGMAHFLKLKFHTDSEIRRISVANGSAVEAAAYVLIFINIENTVSAAKCWVINDDNTWSILLGRPWLKDVKAVERHHDQQIAMEMPDGYLVSIPRDEFNAPAIPLDVARKVSQKKRREERERSGKVEALPGAATATEVEPLHYSQHDIAGCAEMNESDSNLSRDGSVSESEIEAEEEADAWCAMVIEETDENLAPAKIAVRRSFQQQMDGDISPSRFREPVGHDRVLSRSDTSSVASASVDEDEGHREKLKMKMIGKGMDKTTILGAFPKVHIQRMVGMSLDETRHRCRERAKLGVATAAERRFLKRHDIDSILREWKEDDRSDPELNVHSSADLVSRESSRLRPSQSGEANVVQSKYSLIRSDMASGAFDGEVEVPATRSRRASTKPESLTNPFLYLNIPSSSQPHHLEINPNDSTIYNFEGEIEWKYAIDRDGHAKASKLAQRLAADGTPRSPPPPQAMLLPVCKAHREQVNTVQLIAPAKHQQLDKIVVDETAWPEPYGGHSDWGTEDELEYARDVLLQAEELGKRAALDEDEILELPECESLKPVVESAVCYQVEEVEDAMRLPVRAAPAKSPSAKLQRKMQESLQAGDLVHEEEEEFGHQQRLGFPVTRRPCESRREMSDVSDEVIDEWFENYFPSMLNPDLLTPHELALAKRLLYTWKDVMAVSVEEMATTDLVEHRIPTYSHARPVRARMPLYTQRETQWMITNVPKMANAKVIVSCESPWSAKSKFPEKASGDLRMVHGYVPINAASIVNQYPIQRMEPILQKLGQVKLKWFAQVDASNGFWAVPIYPPHAYKTAFSTVVGQFCYLRMGFGLAGAPSTYNKLKDIAMGYIPEPHSELPLKDVMADVEFGYFFDDDTVGATTFTKLLEFLHLHYFPRMHFARISLNPKKSSFFIQEVTCLGMLRDQTGVRPSVKKARAIAEFPTPTNPAELDQFLWMLPWLKSFIPGRADIALGLKTAVKYKFAEVEVKGAMKKRRQVADFVWTLKHQSLFEEVKQAVASRKLGGGDPNRQYHLFTDASKTGAGAVLLQLSSSKAGALAHGCDAEEYDIIMFMSWPLSAAEMNYSTTEREALAVVKSLAEVRWLIVGAKYPTIVYTDHEALRGVFNDNDSYGRIARWEYFMGQFKLMIVHVPGKQNGLADGLSRIPHLRTSYKIPHPDEEFEDPSQVCFEANALSDSDMRSASGPSSSPLPSDQRQPLLEKWSRWLSDEWYAPIVYFKLFQELYDPSKSEPLNRSMRRRVCREAKRFSLIESDPAHLVYHERSGKRSRCIQKDEVESALYQVHNVHGHFGSDVNLLSAHGLFWWPSRAQDIRDYYIRCTICQMCQPLKARRDHLKILQMQPMDLLGLDYMGPIAPVSRAGNRYILVVIDYATRYCWLFATSRATSMTTLRHFLKITNLLGWCRMTYSDNGKHFTGGKFPEVVKANGVVMVNAPPQAPSAVGLAERVVQLVKKVLRALVQEAADLILDWDTLVPRIQHLINTRIIKLSGFSPVQLLFGFDARLLPNEKTPDDEIIESVIAEALGRNEEEVQSIAVQHFASRMDRLDECRRMAMDRREQDARRNALRISENPRDKSPEKGDLVLVRRRALDNQKGRKLEVRWDGPFRVTDISRNGMSATVQDLRSQAKSRQHFRNLVTFVPSSEGDLTNPSLEEIRKAQEVWRAVEHESSDESDHEDLADIPREFMPLNGVSLSSWLQDETRQPDHDPIAEEQDAEYWRARSLDLDPI